MGVAGAFLTGDFFNLYVWFEVMLVASFVLMALNRTRAQMEAAFKYVTINLIASSVFLTALGLLYGATGTLNMADLARVWPTISTPGVDTVLAVLFLIAFSIKAGLFPLFFWLPASYHTPPAPIGAAFAGLLTKVGVYALIRVFTLLFHSAPPPLFALLLGDVGGDDGDRAGGRIERTRFPPRPLVQSRRSHRLYDGESQPADASSAGRRHLLRPPPHRRHHEPVSGEWRAVAIAAHDGYGGLGGMYRDQPLFSALAMIPIFSLAGVPPLSGFLGKLAILEGTFAAGAYWVGGLVLVVGLLTLLSMGRTWADDFWRPAESSDAGRARHAVPGRDCRPQPVDAGDDHRRRAALRAHVARCSAVAAPGGIRERRAGSDALMLLGSILLALAWAALQGEVTLANLLVGYVVGYAILALLGQGWRDAVDAGVANRSRVRSGGLLRVGTADREFSRRRRCAARQPD